jgi:hypothetical protein
MISNAGIQTVAPIDQFDFADDVRVRGHGPHGRIDVLMDDSRAVCSSHDSIRVGLVNFLRSDMSGASRP